MIPTPPNLVDQDPDEWLPPGWTVKAKIRPDGKRDKFFFSPSGIKFNSKVGVCRHLGLDSKTIDQTPQKTPCVQSNASTVGSNLSTKASTANTSKKTISPKLKPVAQPTSAEKSQDQSRGGDSSSRKVHFERVPADGLPPGWIKEFKIQTIRGKIRRDAYFTDPVHGYVFRSMKDTLRYIETGDPGRLAIIPKSPDAAETVKVVGNKRKLQLVDGPVWKSNEITADEKDGTSALNHTKGVKQSARTIRKSTMKSEHGARSSKIEKDHISPRRSSGRITALKEKTEAQITEQSTTKNHVVTEALRAFSSETSSCKGPSKSLPDTDSSNMASILSNKTGNGCKRGSKSPLIESYEDSWLDPCIDFAVKTLTGTAPTGKDLSVHDYIGQSQGDVNGTPPGFNHVSQTVLGGGKWNNEEVPRVKMGMSGNANVQKSVGSGSMCNWVRGTDRSLFR